MEIERNDMPNPQDGAMTTVKIGRLVGYSTQQVRDLERLGVIPTAERRANGYRSYRRAHLDALRAYRALASAIGPVPARQLMPTLLGGSLEDAAERIDDLHVAIATGRGLVREALRGLDAILRDDTETFDDRDAMTIGELAGALGIRTSALRHWEAEGLVRPDRSTPSRMRIYGARAISEARVVAALRSGGYPIPPIAAILDQLRSQGMTVQARRLLDDRLRDLTRRSVALLDAAGHLHTIFTAGVRDSDRMGSSEREDSG